MEHRTYIAIDLKSFYASVECRERGLDPLDTNLAVADESRTDKTICLAVSLPLKNYGISGRVRLFDLRQKLRIANAKRSPCHGYSYLHSRLMNNPHMAVDCIITPPRMAYYMEYSARIYRIYLKYISRDDIIVYSIDEVFMDVTKYLGSTSAHDLAMTIIRDVLASTGITATAGIGSNLFLAKVAMDIVAKHMSADTEGVRIAELDEMSYRRALWAHRPLTDFWRIGRGYAKKLAAHGLHTMGDIARCSLDNEDLLYRLFGKNAELLIDHAWGWEPCTIQDIKTYKPHEKSLTMTQILRSPYSAESARLVVKEMADQLVLRLNEHAMLSDQISMTIGYDAENLRDPERRKRYRGEVTVDSYGRRLPKHTHGSTRLSEPSSQSGLFVREAAALFDRIINSSLLIRQLSLSLHHVGTRQDTSAKNRQQLELFESDPTDQKQRADKEQKMQEAVLGIKKKFGKNAILRGISLEKEATSQERNAMIGGHKA